MLKHPHKNWHKKRPAMIRVDANCTQRLSGFRWYYHTHRPADCKQIQQRNVAVATEKTDLQLFYKRVRRYQAVRLLEIRRIFRRCNNSKLRTMPSPSVAKAFWFGFLDSGHIAIAVRWIYNYTIILLIERKMVNFIAISGNVALDKRIWFERKFFNNSNMKIIGARFCKGRKRSCCDKYSWNLTFRVFHYLQNGRSIELKYMLFVNRFFTSPAFTLDDKKLFAFWND